MKVQGRVTRKKHPVQTLTRENLKTYTRITASEVLQNTAQKFGSINTMLNYYFSILSSLKGQRWAYGNTTLCVYAPFQILKRGPFAWTLTWYSTTLEASRTPYFKFITAVLTTLPARVIVRFETQPLKEKVELFLAYSGSIRIASLILNLGTRWRWVAILTVQPLYPQKKNPLNRRLRGLGYVCTRAIV